MAVKHTMLEPVRPEIAAATARENAHFAELMGRRPTPRALADFIDKQRLVAIARLRDPGGLPTY